MPQEKEQIGMPPEGAIETQTITLERRLRATLSPMVLVVIQDEKHGDGIVNLPTHAILNMGKDAEPTLNALKRLNKFHPYVPTDQTQFIENPHQVPLAVGQLIQKYTFKP